MVTAMRLTITLIGLGLVLGLPTNVQAVDPDVKCNANKVKETANYYACRLKAESKAIKKGEVPDFSKCDSKYSSKWGKAESKAGGACPTESDEAAIRSKMVGDADTIVARLSGVRFVDNGDGTVTDNQTGLMWEKKTNDPNDIHYKDNQYSWSATGLAPDGTAFTVFLTTLNDHTSGDGTTIDGCFDGYCDWRLPTIVELQTILLEPYPCDTDPCINPIFGPTRSFFYWSATSGFFFPGNAWFVDFGDGFPGFDIDNDVGLSVRAVRGGL